MKLKFTGLILVVFSAFAVPCQINAQPDSSANLLPTEPASIEKSISAEPRSAPPVGKRSGWYVRPDSKKRFNNFVNNAVGPFTLLTEAAAAGITTGRNAPKEWGGKWDGFGRRYASNIGKSVIRSGTAYALDEAFKLDSRYYLSRDRSVAARFRNALFSTVTSRNRNGNRVIGIPKIAGSVISNVAAVNLWYPSRYGKVHALKGGAITLGFDAALNLTKEFIWKR